MRTIFCAVALALSIGCATKLPPANTGRAFDFARDTFSFPNDTVWSYADGHRVGKEECTNGAPVDRYTRRCFVMAAGVIQFWKFARFEPQAPPVPPEEIAHRIERVRNIAAWAPALPEQQRIVFPGYASFTDLSQHAGRLVRDHLGAGWTTYFHMRKYSMPFVPSPEHQQHIHERIQQWLSRGQPMVLWLYNFPTVNINHAVTVFAETRATVPGHFAYLIYDPNFTDGPRPLDFDPATRQFTYGKTFYYVGGPVHVRSMYLGLFN